MTGTRNGDDVDNTRPHFKADPFPFYARLRREQPVRGIRLPNRKTAWLITRYDDVVAALKEG
jgi:cytochrome P450